MTYYELHIFTTDDVVIHQFLNIEETEKEIGTYTRVSEDNGKSVSFEVWEVTDNPGYRPERCMLVKNPKGKWVRKEEISLIQKTHNRALWIAIPILGAIIAGAIVFCLCIF